MADYRQEEDASIPRGIRNNNPGDIKPEGAPWNGSVGDDGTFVIFSDMSWGLRALATDLVNKMTKDGLITIRGIVTKYAPYSENLTDAYIAAVSGELGVSADQVLPVDSTTIHALVRAVINHEVGDQASSQYISDADIDNGISMMNSGLQGLLQAAAAQIEDNPGKSLLIGLGVAIGLYYLFK